MAVEMPARGYVHPDFDGHPERGLLDLTPEERLRWIWEGMVLLRAGARARSQQAEPSKGDVDRP